MQNLIPLIAFPSIPFLAKAQATEHPTAQWKAGDETAKLTQKRTNAIASLIRDRFQKNADNGNSRYNGTAKLMNFQLVISFRV